MRAGGEGRGRGVEVREEEEEERCRPFLESSHARWPPNLGAKCAI